MKKNSSAALMLFDCDLRIMDNEAFFHAAASKKEVLPLFILDEENKRKLGEASKWFLHFALKSFSELLKKKYDLNLVLKKGDSLKILAEIFSSKKIDAIYFNKSVEPYNIKLHDQIKKLAKENKIEVFEFLSQTIFDPQKIKNTSGNYFKVFTPFWKHCLKNSALISKNLDAPAGCSKPSLQLENDDLKLLPQKNWAKKFEKIWEFDHKKILKSFEDFLENKSRNYNEARNIPSLDGTSKLSPYLHFGMVSARQIFWLLEIQTIKAGQNSGLQQFLNELGWREFCHHLLFHFPELLEKSFYPEFDNFPWQENPELLEKWQKGETGYPLVDAGMRQLWKTGWMHNRVRMVVASFLIKHLLIDWRIGEKWFWDCLVDADLANNSASWQWVAGSGADAAPYYRIFNPTLQAERFDKSGEYIRKWVPEISKLPDHLIIQPWEADNELLKSCGIKLGETYPLPIVDHVKAREMALILYKTLK